MLYSMYMSDYYDTGSLINMIVTITITAIIYLLGIVVLIGGGIAGQAYMFDKAGEKPWKAIIPFYSLYVLFGVSWKKSRFFFWLSGFSVFIIGFYITGMVSLDSFFRRLYLQHILEGLLCLCFQQSLI